MSDRPDPDDLETLKGYVTQIDVIQEGERDLFTFVLVEDFFNSGSGRAEEWWFWIYLDVGATVALAQLHLLRDAMANDWLVEVDYDPDFYIPEGYSGLRPPPPINVIYPAYSVMIRRRHEQQNSLYELFIP